MELRKAKSSKAAREIPSPLPPAPLPERILVPLDFSPCSLEALRHALTLARVSRAELLLLHVAEPPQIGWMMETEGLNRLYQAASQNALRRLEELAEREVRPHVPVRTLLAEGRPYSSIARMAAKTEASLIVIGTHGHARLRTVVLGSNAERVARHAPCPVLIVRSAPAPSRRRKP